MYFNNTLPILVILILILICSACSDNDPAPDCNISAIAITSVENTVVSGCGDTKGVVVINAAGGEGSRMYSLNDGLKQESNTFTNLVAGMYTAKVEDAFGCFFAEDVQVLSGISFNITIKPIIQNSCSITGCHIAGTGLPNFTNLSEIQERASQVKSRTQTRDMPRSGSITVEEIAVIACWVDDGALDN